MSDTNTRYTLTVAELPAVHAWLAFQNSYGQGMKQVSPADASDYLYHMRLLADAFPGVQNPVIQSWFNQYFSFMTATDEVAKISLLWQ